MHFRNNDNNMGKTIIVTLIIIALSSVYAYIPLSKPLVSIIPHKAVIPQVQRSPSIANIRSSTSLYSTKPAEIVKEKKPNVFASIFQNYWLVMGEVLVIALAHHNPALGASGGILKPEFFISKVGVFTIFFINGVALSLSSSGKSLSLY